MIAVKKSLNKIPVFLINQVCEDRENIKSSIYGAKDVRCKLKNLYQNKCAYCESFEPEFEIEHYRPKKQIEGIPRKEHKGYYTHHFFNLKKIKKKTKNFNILLKKNFFRKTLKF
ncbi:MAG: hypothetical protein B6I24_06540 [Bacteroidetes bacterium 4572_128]|nr:MAG: hypothetical protein B6I24_06540 [Bacteroidetes bacterium 4572_128]